MPNYQATLFFDDGQKSGWSESYYRPDTSYSVVAGELQTLVTKRIVFLHNLYRITGARISDLDIERDSYLPVLSQPFPINGTYIDTAYGRPPPALCMNVRVEAGPFHRGRKFMRGLALGLIDRDGLSISTNPLGFDAFVLELQNWALKVRVLPNGYALQGISNAVIRGIVRRKPGRPFGSLRGRRVRFH